MLWCAAAAILVNAQMDFRYYVEIQPQEAAEFARMLRMHYHSFNDQKKHQDEVVELLAALADGPCALLKFVYEATREPLRCSLAYSLRKTASSRY